MFYFNISIEIKILLLIFILFFFSFIFSKSFKIHSKGIILITGSSTGIGRHITEYLSLKGYYILAGIRFKHEEDDLNSLKIPTLLPVYLDVTNLQHCSNLLETITKLKNKTNLQFIGLINNAGYLKSIPIEYHNLDDAKKMFDTNFFGAMNLIQLTLPLLRESQGRIINISSFTAIAGPPLAGVYAATKGAIESFSDSLRREVAHFGISVSLIEPCYVATSLLSAASSESHTAVRQVPPPNDNQNNTQNNNKNDNKSDNKNEKNKKSDNNNKKNKNDAKGGDVIVDYKKLYAPLYSSQVEAIIKFCVKRASSPQVTTDAIVVLFTFFNYFFFLYISKIK